MSGSSQMRIANLRSPKTVTSAAPGAVCNTGLTSWLAISESCSELWVSELMARKTTGKASASTLAITGSSMPWGSRWRTRETLSRTSAAAESASRLSAKRIEIRLRSWRLIDVITSTPSIPASESSSTLVTWPSITSLEAPPNRVCTLTTGSSIFGYSRTDSRLNETAPIRTISSDNTVAKTGRRMDVSANCIRPVLPPTGLRRHQAPRPPPRRLPLAAVDPTPPPAMDCRPAATAAAPPRPRCHLQPRRQLFPPGPVAARRV